MERECRESETHDDGNRLTDMRERRGPLWCPLWYMVIKSARACMYECSQEMFGFGI